MPLLFVQITSIESGCLVAYFSRSDVQKERTDGIALWVMKIIELVHPYVCHGREGGMSSIAHHRDEAADLWSKAGDVTDQIEATFTHSMSRIQLRQTCSRSICRRTHPSAQHQL